MNGIAADPCRTGTTYGGFAAAVVNGVVDAEDECGGGVFQRVFERATQVDFTVRRLNRVS